MKREKLIFVVVFMVCSFIGGRLFAAYELQKPTWCVVDCGFSVTVTSGTTRLDCSIGGIGPDDTDGIYSNDAILESPTGETILEPGFYHINYSSWVENPRFVFDDNEIGTTTIKFKLDTGSNPDWTQYAIAYSTGVNPADLFTGTIYSIKRDGSIDWNPASFYEGVELTGLQPNTIYGFKIKSRIPPPEQVSTDWSGDTDNYFWTHIQTPGISVKVYITSATVTAVTAEGQFSNLGAGLSGINYRIKDRSWEGWTTDTTYTFTGLDDNTPYIFEVKARNGQTPTPYETGVVSTTSKYTLCYPPTNPDILDVSVSSYSLTLVWSPSPSAPKYYLIKEDKEFIDDNEDDIPDQYTGLSLDRDSLTKVNFRYTYQIYAVNQADEYDEISSVSISTYTFCSIPPAPQTEGVSENTINIGIKSGGNPLYTKYSIKVSGGGSVNYVQDDYKIGGSEVFNTNAEWGDPLTISTLLSNVEYDISVQAMNMNGHVTGYGAFISSCTYASVPGLTIEELTNSVRITIDEGNNSPKTEYEIYEEVNDGSGWQGRGYLQQDGGANLVNHVWQTKADWEAGGGFIVPDLDLLNYGYRFKVQARRTIAGYSKEETEWSSYAYAGKVVNTPIAEIGSEPLEVGTTKYYNTDQTVTFTATGADDLRYTYTINGPDPAEPTKQSVDGGPPPVTRDLTASAGESNTYKMKAKAWKGEDLQSEVGGVWIAVIDKDPPTIDSFSIVEGTYTTHRDITLEISATGADEMYISGDVLGEGNWINYSASREVLLTEEVGEKVVNLRVRDRAGNVTPPLSNPPESLTITLDPYPPEIHSVTINGGDLYTSSANIDLSIVATNANFMLIDGDVIEEEGVTGDWIVFSPSKQVILTSGDEEKTVTVKVAKFYSATLWTETSPKSDAIILDTIEPQNPTFTLSDPESGSQDYTNNSYVNVTVSTSTLDPDVKWYILSKDYPTQPHRNDPAWSPVLQPTFSLWGSDGRKTVFLWVKDGAEHINVGVSSATITWDTMPPANPTLVLSDQATGSATYTRSPTVNVVVANDSDAVAWLISENQPTQPQENAAWGSEPATFTLSMGEVQKRVYVWVKDAAGNINPGPVYATITLETTPPEIQGNIGARFVKHDNEELPEGIETGCKTPTFVWTATDTPSGIDGYSYSFSTNIGDEPDMDITINSIRLKLEASDSDGTYYFKVKAKDKAGNFSEVKSFEYNYKADGDSPEVASIDIEGKKRIEDEVKGVERSNTLPEISFTEEVWGVENYVEVRAIRDNEGKDKSTEVNCTITYEGGLWKVDPGKDWGSNYTYRVKAKDGIEDNAGNALKEEKELIFTTMLDHTKRNVVMWESDPKTKMILEANALKEDGYILIDLEPLPLEKGGGAIEAKEVNPKVIIEADEKIKRSADRYCYNLRESMRETSGYTTEGGEMVIKKFLNTVYVELPYGDENNNGIVDSTEGSSAPVSVKTLSVYWLDEDRKLWVKVSGTEVDKKNKVARAKVIGFGVYTLMGGGFYDLSDAYAYPVPYKPNDGLSTTGDETSGITFTNLSTEAEIKIYTITGELVKKLIHKNGWYEEWYPVENEKGEKVVSGVYIYYIENIKQHKSGKLVIIR
jgi:hypothetical protein